MRRLIQTGLAALCLSILWPSLSDSQWSRVEIDGEQMCVRRTGEVIDPEYASPSWASGRCESFNIFESWLQTAGADLVFPLAVNSDGTIDSKYPDGGKPTGGAACSTWTCAQKGDANGSIDEVSASALDFSANSSNTLGNIDYAYQLVDCDGADCFIETRFPSSYTGYTDDNFIGFGPGVTESVADSAYFVQGWCTQANVYKVTWGTPSSNQTLTFNSDCKGNYMRLEVDDSASQIAVYASTDSTNWTRVGDVISKALTCAEGTSECPLYVWGTSSELGNTTFATITEIATGSTLEVLGEGGGTEPSPENILWNGTEATGYPYNDWTTSADGTAPQFAGIPNYGRPVEPDPNNTDQSSSYFGNGDLMGVVKTDGDSDGLSWTEQGPVREGTYSTRVTVKNSANGTEPDDCDVGSNCTRRRTELWAHTRFGDNYDGYHYDQEWWGSISIFLPADWDDTNGSSWGPHVTQIKPTTNNSSISPCFAISLNNDDPGWRIWHRWEPTDDPDDNTLWQYQMSYTSEYPRDSAWPDGLVDFPDETASKAALANLNKGGWTDFVWNIHFDGDGAASGGVGFLDLWMRAGSGSWVKVLDINPKEVTRGGETFDHGICYKKPGAGFGPIAGMYMDKEQAWSLSSNRVLYNDNLKVAPSSANFVDLSPDGTAP